MYQTSRSQRPCEPVASVIRLPRKKCAWQASQEGSLAVLSCHMEAFSRISATHPTRAALCHAGVPVHPLELAKRAYFRCFQVLCVLSWSQKIELRLYHDMAYLCHVFGLFGAFQGIRLGTQSMASSKEEVMAKVGGRGRDGMWSVCRPLADLREASLTLGP